MTGIYRSNVIYILRLLIRPYLELLTGPYSIVERYTQSFIRRASKDTVPLTERLRLYLQDQRAMREFLEERLPRGEIIGVN